MSLSQAGNPTVYNSPPDHMLHKTLQLLTAFSAALSFGTMGSFNQRHELFALLALTIASRQGVMAEDLPRERGAPFESSPNVG